MLNSRRLLVKSNLWRMRPDLLQVRTTSQFYQSTMSPELKTFKYPSTQTVDQVDDFHGTKVSDPYRWLEEDVRTSPEVAKWVEAQSTITKEYLNNIPGRETIGQRMKELFKFQKTGGAYWEGGRLFFTKHDGVQDHFVHYVADSLDGPDEVVIDPNLLSEDGSISVSHVSPSPNASLVAYQISDSGSDWQTVRLRDLSLGKDLTDEVKWVKFSNLSWTSDSQGFFYSRFPAPDEDAAHQQTNQDHKIFYHRVGTHQSCDVLAYHRPDHPEWTMSGQVSKDGRFLVIQYQIGASPYSAVAIRDLSEPYSLPIDVVPDMKNEYNFVESHDNLLYFTTDLDAPRKRLIAVDIRKPQRSNWIEILPQNENTLESAYLVNGILVASYLTHAHSKVDLYRTNGKLLRKLELPGIGSACGFTASPNMELLYTFSSMECPARTYRYDIISGETELWRQSELPFNPDDFKTEQIFVTSKDGTKVPAFVTSLKSVKLDGSNPTLLYGYGGFNISVTPSFSSSRIAWCELGGIWVTANIRGGGEYGEPWHTAGQLERKQNVFDDFIAVAEYLIDRKYTSSQKLGIYGGSNGGLLVAAVMVQVPHLFGAVVAAVGVLDMLRFHKFTAGAYWTCEYGCSDEEKPFEWLYAYSPYHRVLLNDQKAYPATLVITADTDDRVVPSHSFKFGAALQKNQSGEAPILLRIETKAGHGSGAAMSKHIVKESDIIAFLLEAFNHCPNLNLKN